jgi:hypothetical protein
MSRLLLQICTGLLALIPIATGIVTMLGVKDPLYRPLGLPEAPVLDSNLRFLGGIWLGIGRPTSASSFWSFWAHRCSSTGNTGLPSPWPHRDRRTSHAARSD